MKKIITLAIVAVACAGCARFTTTQKDIRYEAGKPGAEITTKVSAWTLFSSKSRLTDFTAKQSEATQAAQVGQLEQQGATNVIAALQAMVDLAKQVK